MKRLRHDGSEKGRAACIVACALVLFAFAPVAEAFWPFSSGEKKKSHQRLSELMEPASLAIDLASDYAADGKIDEAMEAYRKALVELDKVERADPERAATPEFATVRNKRAYVNAALDSLQLAQARENAKAVAVTDTTALERKLAEKRSGKPGAAKKPESAASAKADDDRPPIEDPLAAFMEEERDREKKVKREAERVKAERTVGETIKKLLAKDPKSRKARVMMAGEDMRKGRFDEARAKLQGVLSDAPGDISALNMIAACEAATGDFEAADKALDRAVEANPRDYHAYYNRALLTLQAGGSAAAALDWYETGREAGGPEDARMESLRKEARPQ